MIQTRKLPVALAVPAVLLGLGAFAVQKAAPADLSASIAVVDIDRVLAEYDRFAERTGQIRQQEDAFNGDLDLRKKAIQSATDELVTFEKGTESWFEARLRIDQLRDELEARAEFYAQRLRNALDELKVELYDEVVQAVGDYATAKNLQLVMRWRTAPAGPGMGGVLQTNAQREVLWRSDALDATAAVIKFMKGWKATPGAGGK